MRLIQRAETIKELANGLWQNKHTGGKHRSAMTGDVTPEFVNVSVERMFTAAKLVDEVGQHQPGNYPAAPKERARALERRR
jgi:hypothetical protein